MFAPDMQPQALRQAVAAALRDVGQTRQALACLALAREHPKLTLAQHRAVMLRSMPRLRRRG